MRLMERVGPRVKRLRRRRGWTQQALADRVGIHQVYVAQIEGAVKEPFAGDGSGAWPRHCASSRAGCSTNRRRHTYEAPHICSQLLGLSGWAILPVPSNVPRCYPEASRRKP